MLNRHIILLIGLTVSLSCGAQTCPPVNTINITHPPAGWKVLVPPQIEDQEYHFGKAIHSLNMSFFFKQVICEYETADSFLAPSFSLLSDKPYEKPSYLTEDWNQPAIIAETLMCAPDDHDPSHCVFE
jgi:hypothetical protein